MMPNSVRRVVVFLAPPAAPEGDTGDGVSGTTSSNSSSPSPWPRRAAHPRHRLGVCALALDTATPPVGRPAPAGILYTAARDGLVLAPLSVLAPPSIRRLCSPLSFVAHHHQRRPRLL